MKKNIFKGMTRKRLPALHMMKALDGEVPLREALAGYFFIMLHDHVKHNCLIKKEFKEQIEKAKTEVIDNSKTLDDCALGLVFNSFANLGTCAEEWSYLPCEDVHIFYLIADTSIEQTQRWIFAGVEKPFEFGPGPIVCRAEWAEKWCDIDNHLKEESRLLIKKLYSEIVE